MREKTSKNSEKLVFDATPLIYLSKIDYLEKLDQLGTEKIIPEKVFSEVVEEGKQSGEVDAERIGKAVEEGSFRVEEAEINEEHDKLSRADLQVLEIAEKEDGIAVMDEQYGRNIAEVEDIETRGTAYLVLRILKQEIIDMKEAKNAIDEIIDEGWYCSTSLYKDIIAKIKEIE
ncbi:MAG: DUF3368 domain-containing protein [Candidatus Nanohaloarchaea archaeon]